jgi:hypothetical protein
METGRMTVLRVLWFREFNQVSVVGGKMETGKMPVLRRKQVFAVGRKKMETGKMPVLRRKQVFAVGRKKMETGRMPVLRVCGFFAADDGEGFDGLRGDGMDGVQSLGQEALQFGRLGYFRFVRWRGKQMHGFDDFLVEFKPFSVAGGGLPERSIDDSGNAIEADGAALEVVAVNRAQDFFGGDKGEGVGRLVGTHVSKVPHSRSFSHKILVAECRTGGLMVGVANHAGLRSDAPRSE